MAPHQDTQTRSRLSIGEDGPSDSALAAARDGRLRRPAAERHAARCASRVLCSGGAPWRYSPSSGMRTKTTSIRKGTAFLLKRPNAPSMIRAASSFGTWRMKKAKSASFASAGWTEGC